jgi:hypothetical protein
VAIQKLHDDCWAEIAQPIHLGFAAWKPETIQEKLRRTATLVRSVKSLLQTVTEDMGAFRISVLLLVKLATWV